MNPMLHFLDRLIQAHGEAMTNVFVYVGLPYVAWFLGRRAGRKKTKQSHTFVLVVRPPVPLSGVSPVIRWNFDPPDDKRGPFG
jgi:hypothetical protein